MSQYLLNLARRAAGLAPVARAVPTATPPSQELVFPEAEEEVAATSPPPRVAPSPQPEHPPETKLDDLLEQLRREIAVVPGPEPPSLQGSPVKATPKEEKALPEPAPVRETEPRTPKVEPAKGGFLPRLPLAREPDTRQPLEPAAVPSQNFPAQPGPSLPASRPSRTPLEPPKAAATVPSVSPPMVTLEKTKVIEVVKVVPVAESETVSVRREAAPHPMVPVEDRKKPAEKEGRRPRTSEKPTTTPPVQPPARPARAPLESKSAAPKPRSTEERSAEIRRGGNVRAAEVERTSHTPPEERPAPVSMPRPSVEPVVPQRVTETAKPSVPPIERPIEVRIGTLEVRGSPPPPAPQPTAPGAPRREGFDSYRSLRDYSGWFRG